MTHLCLLHNPHIKFPLLDQTETKSKVSTLIKKKSLEPILQMHTLQSPKCIFTIDNGNGYDSYYDFPIFKMKQMSSNFYALGLPKIAPFLLKY